MSSRQKQEREWHRQFILERAVAEFARHGYQGTTMDRIAEVAEVSKGTLYNYFSNKRELFLSIIDWGSSRAREIVEKALEDEEKSIEERLRIFVDHFMHFFETGRDIHRILMTEGNRIAISGRSNLAHTLRPDYLMMIDFLAEFISRGQKEGAFRQSDPRRAAIIVLNIIGAELSYSIFSNYPGPVSSYSNEVAQFVLGSLGINVSNTDPEL